MKVTAQEITIGIGPPLSSAWMGFPVGRVTSRGVDRADTEPGLACVGIED